MTDLRAQLEASLELETLRAEVKRLRAIDFRSLALGAIRRARQAGESHEMLARWISEDIHSAMRHD